MAFSLDVGDERIVLAARPRGEQFVANRAARGVGGMSS